MREYYCLLLVIPSNNNKTVKYVISFKCLFLTLLHGSESKTKDNQDKISSLIDYRNLRRKKNPIMLVNTASSFIIWGSFGNFLRYLWFCEMQTNIRDTHYYWKHYQCIIGLLPSVVKNWISVLGLNCSHNSSNAGSLSLLSLIKKVDNCDNVTRTNRIFNVSRIRGHAEAVCLQNVSEYTHILTLHMNELLHEFNIYHSHHVTCNIVGWNRCFPWCHQCNVLDFLHHIIVKLCILYRCI